MDGCWWNLQDANAITSRGPNERCEMWNASGDANANANENAIANAIANANNVNANAIGTSDYRLSVSDGLSIFPGGVCGGIVSGLPPPKRCSHGVHSKHTSKTKPKTRKKNNGKKKKKKKNGRNIVFHAALKWETTAGLRSSVCVCADAVGSWQGSVVILVGSGVSRPVCQHHHAWNANTESESMGICCLWSSGISILEYHLSEMPKCPKCQNVNRFRPK